MSTVIKVTGKQPRLDAPSTLTTAEQKLFNQLIAACDASHFRRSDLPLLVAFVQATAISQAAAHDPDKIVIWEKSTRLLATLATRLRLAPQARLDPKSAHRQDPPRLRLPWEATNLTGAKR